MELYGGETSPTRTDTPLLGLDLTPGRGRRSLVLDPRFEHAVLALDDGRVRVGAKAVEPGWLALVPAGIEELPVETDDAHARYLLLGGVPLGERIAMWWNFVACDQDELTEAWRDWQAHDTGRFPPVPSDLTRIDAPPPPWVGEL